MRKYKSNGYLEMKMYLNRGKSKYCIVRVYRRKIDMQRQYKKDKPSDTHHFKTLGLHQAYTVLRKAKDGRLRPANETGTIYLCAEHCSASIATHEIMHGIFWARGHSLKKDQYPIVIKDMKDEERLLQDFTFAVRQFYNWYWNNEDDILGLKKK